MSRDVQLPQFCIRCNQPGVKRFRKTIYWHEPWVYVLILPGILIYAIVAMVLRKKAVYGCSLCEVHAKRRLVHLLVTWLLVLIGAGTMVAGFMGVAEAFGKQWVDTLLWFIPLGILLLLTAAFYSIFTLPLLKPRKVDEHYAHYSGCGEAFLANFPSA